MSRQQKELKRLWNEMAKVEAWPTKNESEFKSKQRELSKLKAAYEKARGVSDSERVKDAVGKAKSFGAVFGGRQEHETADSLHDYGRDSKRYK